jgi:hypothetical protein
MTCPLLQHFETVRLRCIVPGTPAIALEGAMIRRAVEPQRLFLVWDGWQECAVRAATSAKKSGEARPVADDASRHDGEMRRPGGAGG